LGEPERRKEPSRTAEVKIRTRLRENDVLVPSSERVEELSSRGYGMPENGNLALNFCEALFLLGKDIIDVVNENAGATIGFQDLLKHFQPTEEDAWVKYLIYRDLRSRGYVVREGFGLGIDFRVYERGEYGKETAKYLILGVLEGKPVTVEELAQVLRHVHSLKKRLVLAVLNRIGEVVYYTLSSLTMK